MTSVLQMKPWAYVLIRSSWLTRPQSHLLFRLGYLFWPIIKLKQIDEYRRRDAKYPDSLTLAVDHKYRMGSGNTVAVRYGKQLTGELLEKAALQRQLLPALSRLALEGLKQLSFSNRHKQSSTLPKNPRILRLR